MWKDQWSRSPTGKNLRDLDSTLPSKKVLGLHSNHKPTNSLLVQLRSQKIGLRAFLHSRKAPGFEHEGGAICECREGPQTVKHVILQCPLWNKERRQMQIDGGEALTRDVKSLLTHPKGVRLAVRFMVATGLLKQYQSINWASAPAFNANGSSGN
jgi:hypothetical protein